MVRWYLIFLIGWGDRICCNVSSYRIFDSALSRSFRSIACHCRWLTGSWLERPTPRSTEAVLDVGKTDELKFRINIWAIQSFPGQGYQVLPPTLIKSAGIWHDIGAAINILTLLLGLGFGSLKRFCAEFVFWLTRCSGPIDRVKKFQGNRWSRPCFFGSARRERWVGFSRSILSPVLCA